LLWLVAATIGIATRTALVLLIVILLRVRLLALALMLRGVILLIVILRVAFALLAVLAFLALAVALNLAFAVLALLLFPLCIYFTLCLSQQPQVMLCVLLEILHRNAVIAKLGVTGQLIVFLNHLAWRATHFAFRA
jgi:hypothetical protein